MFESTMSEDNYPTNDKPLFSPDDLTIFCFPAGVKTWLYPKAAESQIKKLGLVGEKADKFQIITVRCVPPMKNYVYLFILIDRPFSFALLLCCKFIRPHVLLFMPWFFNSLLVLMEIQHMESQLPRWKS